MPSAMNARARLALRRSPAEARRIFSEIVPSRYRTAAAEALVHSIRTAHRAAPSKWGLRLNADSIMLKVGFVEVLQFGDTWFHEIVLGALVPKAMRRDKRLSFSAEIYRNAPDCDACDTGWTQASATYRALRKAHEAAIEIAARSRRHTTTIATHSPGLVVFLADELEETVPQPEYELASAESVSTLAEEIPANQSVPAGFARQVLVNRYERDPEARRLCIAHHGTSCAVCQKSMSDRYGPDVEGFIHVHHLTPISELGDDAYVDPIRDLRPVCPNCHAVIHSGPELRSIQQVRAMLR